ncbi:hypothetical protein HC251_20995 [Iamia sp. SCSIO 61187]|uniref:hypothetical protein n=1 Tax=Iamia sp. SCSIO 61187 TaxID=2722752 RepID=UPI001C637FB8|nr:hypothetical protein [Iamia sp. SCSIO 61187]QYG94666.1 hypothetical protein HC251_20995 [Iamia sp. SCSIO 61187]
MRAIPRALAALGVASALTLGAVPGSAQEDTVVVPRAEAQAATLRVSLFGQQLVIGAVETAASSAPTGSAGGVGALLGPQAFGESSASADADTPTSGSEEPTCGELPLPDIPVPVDISAPSGLSPLCSASQASASEGAGTGSAQAQPLTIDVNVADLPLPPELGDVTDQVVAPILDLLGQAPLPVEELGLLQTALELILDGAVSIVTIESGPTEATSTASGTAASGTATAEGLVVRILDGLAATITVGGSTATATYSDGTLTAQHVAAPVTVEFGAPLVAAGLPGGPIAVPPGQTVQLPLPPPLDARIVVASGEDEVGETTARSSAAAVRLDLLTGLPEAQGGIVLAASDAAAAVERPAEEPVAPPAAPPADPPAAAPAPPASRAALPRTGGEGGWVPVGVLLGVGAGITVLVLRRTRTSPV